MTPLKKDKAPLFYQLTNEEWVETVKDLTGAEIKVLYYLRSLDPFGDRVLDYSVTQMALKLLLSKGAVSKALKRLDQMGLIEVELVRVKVRIKTNKNNITEFPEKNSVSYKKQLFPIGNDSLPEETNVSYKKQMFPIGNEQQAEALPDKDSGTPHTIQTYKTFKDSLSDGEREDFLKFGEKKARELPNPPTLTRRWIETNWQELSAQWYKSKGQSSPAQSDKWENDPRRADWLAIIEETANPLEFAVGDREKLDFIRWAKETKQFSWLKGES